MSVKNEPIFQEFCDNRGLAQGTIDTYRGALQKYSNYTHKTLEELIQEADDEEEANIRMRKRKIKNYLTGFKKWLSEQDYSSAYANQMYVLVRSFYSEFDIELPKNLRRKSRRDKKKETIEDIPTMDDVKKSLDYSSHTYRALTLLMVSSGMSRAEVCSLTFKHFYEAVGLPKDFKKPLPDLIEKVKSMDNLIPTWKIRRVKTTKPYFTFCSPQATDAILEYLDQQYRAYEWQPEPKDQLFRHYELPITKAAVARQYQRINKKAGLPKSNGKILIRPHSLRKLFATTLEKNRMPHLMTRWLLGHTIDGTTDAYFKADPEALKLEYLDVVNELCTDEVKVMKITTEGYDDVIAKIEDLRLQQVLYERQINALKEGKS